MAWTTFYLRPDRQADAYWTEDFLNLKASVEEWLLTNRSRSTKVNILDGMHPHGPAIQAIALDQKHTFAFLQVKLRSKRDAILFKVFFSENIVDLVVQPYDRVLLGLVRRAMPSIIARDICGVSPMMGPTAAIFKLRARYEKMGKKARKDKKKVITKKLIDNTLREIDKIGR